MRVYLVYLLAFGVSIVLQYVYGILYGVVNSVLIPISLLQRLPAGFVKYHNRIYLHLLWISGKVLATFGACVVLAQFQVAIGWAFLFLLCLGPIWVFFSKDIRAPENFGYFNFPGATAAIQYAVILNRLEGASKMVGVFTGLVLVRW